MNSKDIRKYWSYKYNSIYGKEYTAGNFLVELSLIKKLLFKYEEYVVLEAIDRFLESVDKSKAFISYFASNKVFENKFEKLIKNKDIVKYKRTLNLANNDIRDLIKEYEEYSSAIILSNSEKIRKKEILDQLEEILRAGQTVKSKLS